MQIYANNIGHMHARD